MKNIVGNFTWHGRLALMVCFFLLAGIPYSHAQSSLSYGDVVIVGFNNNIAASGNRDYQWIPLVSLAPGTVIKFSAAGFNSNAAANATNNARPTAGITVWANTTGATIPAGTVITNDNAGGTTLGSCSALSSSCGCGAASTAYMVQSTGGGRFFIYDGGTSSSTSTDFASSSVPSTFNGSPLMLFGFQGTQSGYTSWLTSGSSGNFLTYLPSDMGSCNLFLAGNTIGGYYNGPRFNGTVTAFRAAICNPANWVTVSGSGTVVTYPSGNFTFGSAFSFGSYTTISVNRNSSSNPINANLAVVDTTTGLHDTISVIHATVHGHLGGFPFMATSAGGIIAPSGLSYTPDTGYTGADSFTARIGHGTASTIAIFRINVVQYAPTNLSYGDILITGINNNTAPIRRSYQWVPLKNLGAGTVIKFTNAGFASNASANTANNAVTTSRTTTVWVNSTGATIAAGTLITIDDLGNATLGSCSNIPTACGCGSTGSLMTQSTSGGYVFIYNGGTSNSISSDFSTTAAPSTFNGTPISMLGLQGSQVWSSWLTSGTTSNFMTWLPSDLSSSALFLGSSAIGATYTGPRTGGTAASFKAAILNPSNWSTVRDTGRVSYGTGNFSFAAPTHAPIFVSGSTQAVGFCDNAGSWNLNNMLKVMDADTGNTITLSLVTAPNHGTAAVSYTATSTGGVIVPTGVSYTPASSFNGRDTIRVKVSDGTDSAITTIYFTINPSPLVPVISGSSYVCFGGTTTLTASPTGGRWGAMDGNTSVVPTTGVVRGLGGPSGVIYYNTAYNAYSCRSQATYSINVVGTPSAGSLSGATTVCPGSSFSLSTTVGGGTWAINYPGIASVSAGVVTGVAPGGATITYTVSNSCFSSSILRLVTVLGTPVTPGVISGVPNVCEGGATITMTNSLAGGVWSVTNTSLATISSGGVVTGLTAGTDTVIYAYTNSCGITRSVSGIINIRRLPSAGAISGVSSIIRANNAILTESVTGGTWSSTATSLATVNTGGRVYALAVGVDTIKYTVTNSCGVAVAFKSITITASREDNGNGGQPGGLAAAANVHVYPNPATGIVTLELEGATGKIDITVTSLSGQAVITTAGEMPKMSIDLSSLPVGTYFIRLINEGKAYTERVVVE